MSAADLPALEGTLEGLLAAGATLPGTLPVDDHQELWSALRRASAGGKRFRALLLSTHRALGGQRPEAAIQVAAAIELLHTAFVIQDDVIDGDQMRRGAPSLPGDLAARARRRGASPEGARRYGEAAGILAGDLGMLSAVRAIARCEAPAPVVDALLDLVETTIHGSVAGELADVRLQLDLERSAPMREVLAVAELKTALYSFQLPLHAAALLADAEEPVLCALDEIGVLFGIGFQLFDDLLGVFGDEQRTGKSALGDLREGKRTAMLAHAATTDSWAQLHPLLGRADLDAVGAADARSLLTRCGSRTWTEDLARWHLDEANAAAARHGLPPALTREIRSATDEVLRAAEHALHRAPAPLRNGQPA
ncbi:polyprenyl synthetase family protein [Brachybacterium sp. Z12]|uniref:polyprenyl synthetase family protein n=1 Tax=Brachybacterium sp. Z12 TaxID=2759167 RepID=UPI0018603FB3|nr:polyprenyl synthetase family protein [Brachybacterium sp. Z12]QNN82790.1 polyprenyl synthetase family protein [Brachybacterium sp. Z12]